MGFFYLKNLALPFMGDFWEKTIQSGFPAQLCFTRSGVRTICDLEEAVPSLLYHAYQENEFSVPGAYVKRGKLTV